MARESANAGELALAREVLIHGPVSRRELTARLGLSPASLTRLAKPLLEGGLLVELDDVSDGSVGRPTRPLDIAPGAGTFIGIKLTGSHLYAVATGVRAEPLARAERELADTSPDAVITQIEASIEALEVTDLRGIGIALGGYVRDGLVEDAPFLDWADVDLRALLEERRGIPVTVENDLVALAEAERWFGRGRGIPGFTVVTIGAGVGYGLVVDGRTVRTPDAGSGTGGHIPVTPYGPVCAEGHRGCAQAMLTIGSITAQVSTALGRAVDYEEVLRLAAADDGAAARAVVDAAGDALGTFIALAANLTLQSDVVLAGEGMALYPLVADRVEAAIRSHRSARAEPIRIHVDSSGFHAWARGAAAVAIQAAMESLPLSRASGRPPLLA